jgi:hypothetical protein
MEVNAEQLPVHIDWVAHTGRQCGKCSLCCKLLHVVELNKPANKWCEHCRPGYGGCTIHETRPDICRGYFCGWMLSKNVGEEWYPFRCHMILSLGKFNGIQCVTVTVDPNYPLQWKEPPYYAQLQQMARRGLQVKSPDDILLVHVRCRDQVWLITPNKDIEITHGSYIIRLIGAGQWGVEQFASQAEAEQRVAELIKR